MWHTAQTDDYLTALQALVDIATSNHVATVAINAGGTGYVVGDTLTVVGGTSTFVATLIVTSVSSGVIDGVRVGNGGAYTVDPTLSANAATGGTGSGATFDLTMAGTGWTVDRRDFRAARVSSVGAGGTGFANGDIIEMTGGTSTETGTFEVTQVSSGAIVAVTPVAPSQTGTETTLTGKYSVVPSNPVTMSAVTGSGTGCTLNLEYEEELIMEGSGSGSDDITIGIKTYQDTDTSTFNTTFNWALFAFSSYNSSLDFFAQANITPGFTNVPAVDPDLRTTTGAFVPLRDTNGSFPMTFWFNITPRRIIAAFRVEGSITTAYPSMFLGYLNPLGTAVELAFPMYVAGSSHRRNVYYEDVNPYITGLVNMDGGGADNGPGFVYRAGTSSWAGVCNSDVAETGTSRSTSNDTSVYPGALPFRQPNATGFSDIVDTGWGNWTEGIPNTGVPGVAQWEVYPAYGTSDQYELIAASVQDHDGNAGVFQPYGEIDDVFWVGRASTLTSEDTITDADGNVYRIFQSGNRTDEWSYFAIKESF